MYQIKKFFDCYIPITTCNLRCSYCYVAQQGLFKAQVPKFEHDAKEIRKAFAKERVGGTALINLCAGGETLIAEETIEIAKELLEEGHFVMIVTNGLLSRRFDSIVELPESLLRHLFFKFSFHYLELKRLNAFETFFENINKIKRAGASFTVEITPCDEEIPYIEEIKKCCMDNLGALCHVTIARTDIDPEHRIPHLSKYPFEDYLKIWGTFDSELFDFKKDIFYQKRKEFCYAGAWSAYINLGTGRMTQCYCGKVLGNIFENIDDSLNFEAVGYKCTQAHCYNGHVWLTFGDIPEIKTPTYADVRNRKCVDGTEWLQSDMKEMFQSRLYETNKEYSKLKKKKIEMTEKWPDIKHRIKMGLLKMIK